MATTRESTGHCPTCGAQRLLRRQTLAGWAHAVHITLTVLTLGVWLLVYLPVQWARTGNDYHCSVCGTPVDPREPPVVAARREADEQADREQAATRDAERDEDREAVAGDRRPLSPGRRAAAARELARGRDELRAELARHRRR